MAIGNAALWAFARTRGLSGRLHLVDGKQIDVTNLQRYVLTTHEDGEQETLKAELAARALAGTGVDAATHASR